MPFWLASSFQTASSQTPFATMALLLSPTLCKHVLPLLTPFLLRSLRKDFCPACHLFWIRFRHTPNDFRDCFSYCGFSDFSIESICASWFSLTVLAHFSLFRDSVCNSSLQAVNC
jgi:hypothetical protein